MTQNLDIKNPNHPTKGSKTEVDPIRNEKDIKSIKQFLESYPRLNKLRQNIISLG